MPVATRRGRGRRGRGRSRSAVSAVVRTTSAERAGGGAAAAPSAARIRSFSAGRRTVIRNASGRRRTTRPCASSRSARSAPCDGQTKFAGGGRAVEARPRAAPRASAPARRSSPRRRAAGLRSAAAAMRAAGAATGAGSRRRSSSRGDLRRGDRIADPQRGEAERLRERPERDQVRRPGDQRHDRLRRRTRSTPRRRRRPRPGSDAGERGDLLRLDELAGRVVRVADPDEVGARPVVGELGALDPARDRVERVGRLLHERAPAGAEKGPRGERDQPVRAGAGDDLLRLDSGVGRAASRSSR